MQKALKRSSEHFSVMGYLLDALSSELQKKIKFVQ